MPPSCRSSRPTRHCWSAASPKSRPRNGATSRSTSRRANMCSTIWRTRFPTQLFEPFTDEEGNLSSRPVYRDGKPVQCARGRRAARPDDRASRVACRRCRARSTRSCTASAPRWSPRSPAARGASCARRTAARPSASRPAPASANFAETAAFMDDDKRILVFSDAGGTGRSYHADLGAGTSASASITCWSRAGRPTPRSRVSGARNRTNQKQPPVFRPVATDVKGEKRFLSTIARRLDTLGAITRGQRQTGGQGLFRADDNLESPYARAALRQFYQLLYAGKIEGCSLADVRGRDRSRSVPTRTAPARGIAADHAIPQPPAGADASPAEQALRRVRGIARRAASKPRSPPAPTISASRR